MKIRLAVSFATFSFAALASMAVVSAQTTTLPGAVPAPSAFGADPIIQITTTFRARIDGVADARDVPSATAQDTARRLLYNMAANECLVLAEYWKAECRLNSLTVYSSLEVVSGPDVPVASMFGTALYELRLTSLRR